MSTPTRLRHIGSRSRTRIKILETIIPIGNTVNAINRAGCSQPIPVDLLSKNQRAGKEITAKVELKNINGNTKIVKNEYATKLAAIFRSLSKEESRKLGIQGGVLVTNVGSGELAQTQMKRNFIITAVNEENVNTVEQLNNEVNSSDGKVQFSGLYPGYQGVYYYEVDLK